jgi:hypothetical protein
VGGPCSRAARYKRSGHVDAPARRRRRPTQRIRNDEHQSLQAGLVGLAEPPISPPAPSVRALSGDPSSRAPTRSMKARPTSRLSDDDDRAVLSLATSAIGRDRRAPPARSRSNAPGASYGGVSRPACERSCLATRSTNLDLPRARGGRAQAAHPDSEPGQPDQRHQANV